MILNELQIEGAAQVLALAMQDDPLFAYLLPDQKERLSRLLPFFTAHVRFGHLFGAVYTTAGDSLGTAVWQAPGEEITPERATVSGMNQIGKILGPDSLQRLGKTFDHLGEVHHSHLAAKHWYLMAIGVRPDFQRRGIGGALLRPILDQAAADRLPCYLDTSLPENLVFYRKQGFTTLVESVLPGTNLHFWTLEKRP
ncbi:MAG: GNAT family N-acetyltransferase [Ardenticatenaceae bacterium]|nr:GNAT family N-acetyltransferase [Ardenticatenaceae bacterium]